LSKCGIGICWCGSRGVYAHPHFHQEVACEGITVCYHKGPGIEQYFLIDVEMVHIVEAIIFRSWERNTVAPNEGSYMEREQMDLNRMFLLVSH